MSMLNDVAIEARCLLNGLLGPGEVRQELPVAMISPFINHQVREVAGKRVISYGLSSYGYDVRTAEVEIRNDRLLPENRLLFLVGFSEDAVV